MLKELKKLEKYQYYILFIIVGFFVGYLNPLNGFTLGGQSNAIPPPPSPSPSPSPGSSPSPSPGPSPSPSPGSSPSPSPSPSPSASNCSSTGYFAGGDICLYDNKSMSDTENSKCKDASDCHHWYSFYKIGSIGLIVGSLIVFLSILYFGSALLKN